MDLAKVTFRRRNWAVGKENYQQCMGDVDSDEYNQQFNQEDYFGF